MKQLIEKVLPSSKPAMRKQLLEIIVSVHKKVSKEDFIDVTKECFASKNVKTKPAVIQLLNEVLALFGPSHSSVVKCWDFLVKECESLVAPAVRKAFLSLTAELYRWIGDGFGLRLNTLKK